MEKQKKNVVKSYLNLNMTPKVHSITVWEKTVLVVEEDGPVEVPEDVEENRVENLKEEKVKRKREDVKGNVQRKDVENVVVNYI